MVGLATRFTAFSTESSTHKSECHLICRQTLAVVCDGAADYWRILSILKYTQVQPHCNSFKARACEEAVLLLDNLCVVVKFIAMKQEPEWVEKLVLG